MRESCQGLQADGMVFPIGSGEAVKRAIGTRYPDREGCASKTEPEKSRVFCPKFIFGTRLTFTSHGDGVLRSAVIQEPFVSRTEQHSGLCCTNPMGNLRQKFSLLA